MGLEPEVDTEGSFTLCTGFLLVLISLGFLLLVNECLWVVNVEAHAAHCWMANAIFHVHAFDGFNQSLFVLCDCVSFEKYRLDRPQNPVGGSDFLQLAASFHILDRFSRQNCPEEKHGVPHLVFYYINLNTHTRAVQMTTHARSTWYLRISHE